MFRTCQALLLGVAAAVGAPSQSEAAVLFENTGTLEGWSRVYAQEMGTNTVVSTPAYESASAIRSTQTFVMADGRGYHSERVMSDIQQNGEDYYYGLALYLPGDWVFHDQNVTFQQWAYENPGDGGPWILMFVQNDQIRMGGSGASGNREIATITDLRGTWIRIVTRVNMTASGPFEVWVNGTKSLSTAIDLEVGGEPPTIRWSTGIYCTAWRTQQPAGGSPISVYHDHLRVATTYEKAEPANWGMLPPTPGTGDGGSEPGAGNPDAGSSGPGGGDVGSGGASGAVGTGGGMTAVGGAAIGATPDNAGGVPGAPSGRPSPSGKVSGCVYAAGASSRSQPGFGSLCVLLATVFAARRRREREPWRREADPLCVRALRLGRERLRPQSVVTKESTHNSS